MSMVLIEDDGMIPVSMKIGDEVIEIAVDVYDVNNKLIDIQQQDEADESANKKPINERIVELLISLGFPRVSHKAAVEFARAIFAQMAEYRKKDESAPSSSTSAD